jgi:hypothetical protein
VWPRRAAWASGIVALVGAAGCNTIEVFGWVWANQATVASYTPDPAHQYNNTGGTSTVTRSAMGVYQVTFALLGGVHGGNVQVTARGPGSAHCKVNGWQNTAPAVTAEIRCFAGSTPADSEFLASFEATDRADSAVAYAHYDPPATPMVSVTPDPARAWNVTGIYTPTHSVLLAGPVSGFAMENVTADSSGPEFCGFSVNRVTCWDASGAPVDIPFSYVKGLGRVPASRKGAYAVYDPAPGSTVSPITPTSQFDSFSTASPMVVTRASIGSYTVSVPGAATPSASGSVLVHVTALDLGPVGAPVHCKPAGWFNSGLDVVVQVACFMVKAGTDVPTDDGFHLSYIVAP